jgi:hypothetical protein
MPVFLMGRNRDDARVFQLRFLAWALLGLLGAAVFVTLFNRRPSLEDEAKRLANCLATRDVDCVLASTVPGEPTGLAPERRREAYLWAIQRLAFAPPIEVRREEEVEQTERIGSGFFRVSSKAGGLQRAPLSLHVAYGEGKVVAPGLLNRLILHVWAASDEPVTAGSRAEAMMIRMARGIRRDMPELRRLGLNHFEFGRSSGSLEQMLAYYEDAAERIRQKHMSPP